MWLMEPRSMLSHCGSPNALDHRSAVLQPVWMMPLMASDAGNELDSIDEAVAPVGTSLTLPHASNWHVALQPSPLAVLPSSQASPLSTTLLPHCEPDDAQFGLGSPDTVNSQSEFPKAVV